MLVTPDMALVTTTTPGLSVVASRATAFFTIWATWAKASALPTDVPPNFMTIMTVSLHFSQFALHCFLQKQSLLPPGQEGRIGQS
jgi:hypothetical protein